MYRIVKHIVHTITTVTWVIRLEETAEDEKPVEKQITFPSSHSFSEEEVSETINISKKDHPLFNPNVDKRRKNER